MKPPFLTKTLSTVSLIAVIAAIVGTSINQNAQAQAQVKPPREVDADFCIDAQPQDIGSGDSTAFSEASRDIEYSAAQIEKSEAVITEVGAKLARIDENAEVAGPSYGLMFTPKEGIEITPEQWEAMDVVTPAIYDMTDDLNELVSLFNDNEAVNQIGRYDVIPNLAYTPAQIAQRRAIFQERDAQFFAILTPEQQQQFQANTAAINSRNEACGVTTQA